MAAFYKSLRSVIKILYLVTFQNVDANLCSHLFFFNSCFYVAGFSPTNTIGKHATWSPGSTVNVIKLGKAGLRVEAFQPDELNSTELGRKRQRRLSLSSKTCVYVCVCAKDEWYLWTAVCFGEAVLILVLLPDSQTLLPFVFIKCEKFWAR